MQKINVRYIQGVWPLNKIDSLDICDVDTFNNRHANNQPNQLPTLKYGRLQASVLSGEINADTIDGRKIGYGPNEIPFLNYKDKLPTGLFNTVLNTNSILTVTSSQLEDIYDKFSLLDNNWAIKGSGQVNYGRCVAQYNDIFVVSGSNSSAGTGNLFVYKYVSSGRFDLLVTLANAANETFTHVSIYKNKIAVCVTNATPTTSVRIYELNYKTLTLLQTITSATTLATYSCKLYKDLFIMPTGSGNPQIYRYNQNTRVYETCISLSDSVLSTNNSYEESIFINDNFLIICNQSLAKITIYKYNYPDIYNFVNIQSFTNNKEYGCSVSLYNNILAVGCKYYTDNSIDKGSVYIYTYTDGYFVQRQILVNSTGSANDEFGDNVHIDGEFLYITNPRKDYGGQADFGTIFVYKYNSSTQTFSIYQEIIDESTVINTRQMRTIKTIQNLVFVFCYGPGWVKIYKNNGFCYGTTVKYNSYTQKWERTSHPKYIQGVYIGDNKIALNGAIIRKPDWFQNADIIYSSPIDDNMFCFSDEISTKTQIGKCISDNQILIDIKEIYNNIKAFKIINPSPTQNDSFGLTQYLYNDILVVGSYTDDTGGADYGMLFVYKYEGGTWRFIQQITAGGTIRFGESVSVHRNMLISGNTNVSSARGIVYVFRWNGTQFDTSSPENVYQDATNGDQFGRAIASYDNLMVVGSWNDSYNNAYSGSIYLLRYNGASWTTVYKSSVNIDEAYAYFGLYVTMHRNIFAASAYSSDVGGADRGLVRVYSYSNGSVTLEGTLVDSNGQNSDKIGSNGISLFEDKLIIGVPFDDVSSSDDGSVIVFKRYNGVWLQEQKITYAGTVNFGNYPFIYEDIFITFTVGTNPAIHIYKYNGYKWLHFKYIPFSSSPALNNISMYKNIIIYGLNETIGSTTGAGAIYINEYV